MISYIGLGSNLAHPVSQLEQALQLVAQLPQTTLLETSSFYRNKPMGPQDQPDYVNAVCSVDTLLDPLSLLGQLQAIELQCGRERKEERWGPRTLDLDILLFADQVIQHPDLVVPHYGMRERNFVILPLLEIAPNLSIRFSNDTHVSIALTELARPFDTNDLEKIERG
ncbi:MAG: 2-amino-4-hydroxy-6-hydroxymethyldihydropteridine diphosphokinase [Kangiellaceae bacterium]|nr:2-amino-4-hydroxy-6-hydroxymethyldihydropteridine diphosphokinase [Kangiellaceae bacterium]|tara:strand:+ start:10649 stop:11152 length:504 start_codon:yes stop_codon:yes gene_type:complete